MLGNDTVEVQVGKYKGTLFQFGSVSIEEDKESDRLRLKFDYNIESSPVEVDHEEFLQVAGDILANIIGQGEIKKV
jgi:hypothetical protein|tara:strand:- start:1067 stop:1294 length:228 start_codon:yes stop_codon:yes gene_type:complete